MAKDGTNRGGSRVGSGRKKKSADTESPRNTAVFGSEKVPEPAEYLSANQKNGVPLGADKIYRKGYRDFGFDQNFLEVALKKSLKGVSDCEN